jgi:phage baseplate assembly protein W
MTDPLTRFGADLRLLDDLRYANDRLHGSDLHTVVRAKTGRADLQTLDGVDNLSQALLLRFVTRQGELEAIGHPEYGSRLYTLIGELNNATNRNRAKLFVLEALAAEPRVARVESVSVSAGARDRLDIALTLKAIDSDTPLDLVFPFFIGVPG